MLSSFLPGIRIRRKPEDRALNRLLCTYCSHSVSSFFRVAQPRQLVEKIAPELCMFIQAPVGDEIWTLCSACRIEDTKEDQRFIETPKELCVSVKRMSLRHNEKADRPRRLRGLHRLWHMYSHQTTCFDTKGSRLRDWQVCRLVRQNPCCNTMAWRFERRKICIAPTFLLTHIPPLLSLPHPDLTFPDELSTCAEQLHLEGSTRGSSRLLT